MAEPLFTDRALQDAYRALMNAAAHGHLGETTWDRIATGEIDESARDVAFDHVVQCAECSRIWRGILELKKDADTQGLIAPVTQSTSRSWMPLAIAATVLLAVGGVMLMRPTPRPEIVRGTTEVPPIEGLMMAYDPAGVPTLVWPPVSHSSRYRLEVFSEDGRPIWSADVAAPPARWPQTTPRSKGAYRWRVEALEGGRVIARSRLVPMELR